MSTLGSIEREFNQDNIVDAFKDEVAERERLAFQEMSVKTLSELSSDMGDIDAGIIRAWSNDGTLRMILSGEDLYDILGFHAHFIGLNDEGEPQFWVDAENGEIAIAGGAGRLGKLGILMSGLRYAIQQTAVNLLSENTRIGRLEMFLPAGSDVPAWGMTFSDQVEALIKNGDFETGDLTGWNTEDADYFEVVADAKLDGAYGLHVKDVESGTKTIRLDRFAVLPGMPYRFSCKIKEYGYKNQTDAIIASADVSINSAEPNLNSGAIANLFIGSVGSSPADTRRTLLKFDLSEYGIHHILSSAKIKLAHVEKYAANNRVMRVFHMLRDWVEGTRNGLPGITPDGATWNTYDGINAWGTAGAANTSTDRDAVDIGSTTVLASDGTSVVEIALDTSKLTEIKNGILDNFGFQVKMDTEVNDQHVFHSRSSSVVAKRPTLELAYTTPSDYVIRIDFYDSEEDGTLINSIELSTEANSVTEKSIDKAVIPPSGANYAELVIEASQGVGFYVDSISIESFKSIHFTDRGVSVDGNFLVNGSAKTVTDRFYNKSGGAVAEGDAVILDTGNNRAFKTTTTPGSFAALGIAKETIASDALGALATTAGEVAIVNCDSTAVAIGDYLKTSTTSKLAMSNGKVRTANCFAKALTAKASGSTGTVYCMILDHNPVVATPAEINNLVLWLRPESLVGYSEGALLSQWTDESVSANHPVITTDGYKPKVRKSVVSGLDVVEFDGVDDRLISPAVCFSGAGQRTMIAVYKSLQTTAPQYICGQSNISTSYSAYHLLSSSSEGDPIVVTRNLNVTTPFIVSSSWKIGCGDYDGSTIRVFRNNMLGNSQSLSLVTVSTGGFRLANYYPGSSGQYGNAQIAEVIVYNRCLTDNERGAVHEYLSNKYGITLS